MSKADSFATSFIPPWALTCWVDGDSIYTACPSKAGPPLIQRYLLTEGGLSKALNFLRVQPRERAASAKFKLPSPPPLRRLASKDHFTEEQKAKGREILRKLGMI